jgi:hypothetical protein
MDRREVVRIALRSGALLVLTRLSDSEAFSDDDAGLQAASAVQFQQGTLRGGKFEGWEALLATTGRSVRGTIYNPSELGL